GKNSRERRSGQTVLHQILVALTKMFAPMICHTAEEVWGYLPAKETESVHLSTWPEPPAVEKDPKWDRIFEVRAEVQRELEKLRGAGTIGKSLEAKVKLSAADAETRQALTSVDLTSVLIVSEAVIENGAAEALKIQVEKSTHPKCDRCWNLRADVGKSAAHPTLCGRCVAVLG